MKVPTTANAEKCFEIRARIDMDIFPVPVDHRFICLMIEIYPEWFIKTRCNDILGKQETLQCCIY